MSHHQDFVDAVTNTVVPWLVGQTAAIGYSEGLNRLFESIGLREKRLTEPKAEEMLKTFRRETGELIGGVEGKLAQLMKDTRNPSDDSIKRVIDRLDEERFIRLISGFAQFEVARRTKLKQESLASAFRAFHEIASLPEQGETGGFPNAQLRLLAFLGKAAVHIELEDPTELIVENLEAALRTLGAQRWFGEELTGLAQEVAGKALHLRPPTQIDVALQHAANKPQIGTVLLTYQSHAKHLRAITWSPDGKYIASEGPHGNVRVWEALTGKHSLSYAGHRDSTVFSIAWSPDGKYIASGAMDGTAQVWDVADGSHIVTYRGHKEAGYAAVFAVAWSPDSQRIASGGHENTIQLWEALTGNRYFTYRGHTNWVQSVSWSPDGKYIASGSLDGTVQVWQAV